MRISATKSYSHFQPLAAKLEILQDHFVRSLGLTANTSMVDVAGGTGDIAFRAVREIQSKYCASFNKSS